MSLCSVGVHRSIFHSRFHSRYAPGFTPDPRSTSISLNHTRSGEFTHSFNANVVHDHTPSHSIPIPTDRPFKARALGSSPSRLTTSDCRQNFQNDFQALSAWLVVLRTGSKTSLLLKALEFDFPRALTYPPACSKTNNFGNLTISRRKAKTVPCQSLSRPYRNQYVLPTAISKIVSRPAGRHRFSMSTLNRSRSPWTFEDTTPNASPVISGKP